MITDVEAHVRAINLIRINRAKFVDEKVLEDFSVANKRGMAAQISGYEFLDDHGAGRRVCGCLTHRGFDLAL
jgi:hypothetical protein